MTRAEIEELLDGTTPGPWCVGPVDDCMVFAPDRSEVADITGDYNEPDLWPIMEANARLIAAAPTLARRLLAVMEENERLQGLVQDAYYEGYSAGYHTSNPQKDIAPDWLGSDARAALQKGTE